MGGFRCLSLHVRWPDDAFNRLSLGLPTVLYASYYLFPGREGTELVALVWMLAPEGEAQPGLQCLVKK